MQKRLIHLSIIFFLLCPALVVAQNSPLETQLKKAIEGKKAEIGIAVIIDGQDTITVNNDIHYPMMSVSNSSGIGIGRLHASSKATFENPVID